MENDYSICKQKKVVKNIYSKTKTALLREQLVDNNDLNKCYELLKQVTAIAEEEVPLLPKKEQESWMIPEIKDLLKERRSTKHNSVECKNLDRLIKSKCFARTKSTCIKNAMKQKHFIDLILNKHINVLNN